MPALPWKSFATPESGREYAALLSHLPLNAFGAMPRFFWFVIGIRRQLAHSEGLIGYSLDTNIPGKEFWTLSVWEDRDSLWRFVERMPHSQAMQALDPHMGQTAFFHFEVDGSSVPPDWQETRRRMREQGADAPPDEATTEFVTVGRAEDLEEGDMKAFDVEGTRVAVANVAGTFYAFDDTCTHRRCSLAEGDLQKSTVICPCHGSEFDVTDGAVLQGVGCDLRGAGEGWQPGGQRLTSVRDRRCSGVTSRISPPWNESHDERIGCVRLDQGGRVALTLRRGGRNPTEGQ